jgi:uncharacterized protein (DUF1499 family)
MVLAVLACGIAAAGLLLLVMAGPSYRIGLLSFGRATTMLQWGMYLGVVGVAVGGLAAALAYRRRTWVAVVTAAIACACSAAIWAVPFEWNRRARNAPPIHDVSTDLENPPSFEAILPLRADVAAPLDRAPIVATHQREGYPDLAPVILPLPLDQAFTRALGAAQEAGWQIVTADKGSGRIEATDTTAWFGFTDDIVVRLTPWGAGTRVDVRSVSRDREHDMGTNARRIRRYLAALP